MTDPEISTKEHAGEFDAFETAKPGEPIFTVQGGDPFGPTTVKYWADLARAAALKIRKRADREALLKRATNAETVCWKMQEYQKGHVEPKKTPATVEVLTSVEDDQRTARIKAVARLHNILGEGLEIYEALKAVDFYPENFMSVLDMLKTVATITEPRTAKERT